MNICKSLAASILSPISAERADHQGNEGVKQGELVGDRLQQRAQLHQPHAYDYVYLCGARSEQLFTRSASCYRINKHSNGPTGLVESEFQPECHTSAGRHRKQ